jgi:HEPN domain-containing protein
MDEPKRELVRNWLIRAERDLLAAQKLSAEPNPSLDTAIFHCQQAAEKAIKGFLVLHDKRFEKTHDITVLVNLAMPFNNGFSSWLDAGERLTPYAVAFRYPGDVLEPEQEEFDQALKAARGVYSFVLSLLPKEVHPSF